jgi:thiol-disulfide isomerase/thioredoxin
MTAAAVLLGLLGLGNLALTAALAHRLREHATILDILAGPPPAVMRAVGEPVGAFTTAARDGSPISLDLLPAPILVGFFSPGCGPCHAQLPDFVARARRAPRRRTLAVVAGTRGRNEMAASLAEVAIVVVEPPGGTLATAFGVSGFPAFGLVGEDGRIEACGTDLASIPILIAA